MLEHSIYAVISPEGCASILWRDREKAPLAAEALKLTAQDLKSLKLIDEIIEEPVGAAHRAPHETIESVRRVLLAALPDLASLDSTTLKIRRRDKFLAMGREGVT